MTKRTNLPALSSILLILAVIISLFLPTATYSKITEAVYSPPNGIIRIGLVMPTYTDAAYNDKFYKFYQKYQVWGPSSAFSEPVHTDLNLLTSKLLPMHALRNSTYAKPAIFLANHIKQLLPRAYVELLTDSDIDGGKARDFDILVIFHQEYVTQTEYDNLKNFVASGGTLICMDGNIFYAEVGYNRITQAVTLIRGHGWIFDGLNTARREGNYNQTIERWANETSQWLGSNYDQVILGETSNGTKIYREIKFMNNPFGYVHGEEQEVTNPADSIILNYHAILSHSSNQPTIATYQKDFGQGKVIVLGLYTDKILFRPIFLQFFDNLLLIFTPN